jgi:hypothetical protein
MLYYLKQTVVLDTTENVSIHHIMSLGFHSSYPGEILSMSTNNPAGDVLHPCQKRIM